MQGRRPCSALGGRAGCKCVAAGMRRGVSRRGGVYAFAGGKALQYSPAGAGVQMRSRGAAEAAEAREACRVLDHLLQIWRFLREACRVLDHLLQKWRFLREACRIMDRLLQNWRFLREVCGVLDRLLHLVPG